jgi:hypothetical protein
MEDQNVITGPETGGVQQRRHFAGMIAELAERQDPITSAARLNDGGGLRVPGALR